MLFVSRIAFKDEGIKRFISIICLTKINYLCLSYETRWVSCVIAITETDSQVVDELIDL